MEMFVGVRPCVSIFRHFNTLVGSGRSKCEIGAYYFQLRHGMSSSYISAFSSAKWEDWKARPSLSVELDPVLDRVKTLARGGLTSVMVLGDFLRRRIAPLQ
jgi:hypothetical protein